MSKEETPPETPVDQPKFDPAMTAELQAAAAVKRGFDAQPAFFVKRANLKAI
jgi:hypothetical protein